MLWDIVKMLPQKAVLSEKERKQLENTPVQLIEYTSDPLVDFPVLPFQIFGIAYDLDIVIVTDHPKIDMHEFAKVALPDGNIWIAKESVLDDLDQVIYSNRKELSEYFPEVPLTIMDTPVKVVDESSEKYFKFKFKYVNRDGEEVAAEYLGKRKMNTMSKRNGSTMGHSRYQVMAVLDIPNRSFGKRSNVSYSDIKYKTKRILGLKNFNLALRQTQAGLSIGQIEMTGKDNKIYSSHNKESGNFQQKWKLESSHNQWILRQKNTYRELLYYFTKSENELRFSKASVIPWNSDRPIMSITVFPNLPDLRRKFEGTYKSQFVIDVNDQNSHGFGDIKCHWEEDLLHIDIIPKVPWWIKERPMRGKIKIHNGVVSLDFGMVQKEIERG